MEANEAQMANMPPEAKKMMEKTTAQLKETVVKRCKADKWSDAAIKCLTAAKAAEDFDKCEGTLTQEQKDNFEKDMKSAMGMPAEPPAPPPGGEPSGGMPPAPPAGEAPVAGGSGLPECDAYMAAFEKYMGCDKVPQAAKDTQKQALDGMKASWAALKDPNVPADTKKAAADGCKQAEDALKQSAQTLGCTL